jgi:hypothetical protein
MKWLTMFLDLVTSAKTSKIICDSRNFSVQPCCLECFQWKTRFIILNPIFLFNCLQLASCKLQGWCKILLSLLAMLLNVVLVLWIIRVYIVGRPSILNAIESKVHGAYSRTYMHMFHTIQKEFKSSLDWSTLWKQEVNGFWKTLKPIGFWCYSQLKEFYLNTRPYFWKCIKMLALLVKFLVIWNCLWFGGNDWVFCIMPLLEGWNELIKFSQS